ncbi:MAG: type II CRISPR RNA-guided endonuclease Cas9, partial [Coriobacteriia bacterium]|nr:type II CRISPR RNA-guided endonuclease Cas9 [Coriobacteriia bacterium]
MGKKSLENYSIGLDIGVTGVGWSVAHSDGTLAKVKGKPAWGVRLFEEGSHAADRRMKRSARRRYVRRRHRLNMMQEMLSANMQKVDADFFRKMKESALWEEDRQAQNGLALLLKNVSVDGEPYHKKFPTIYHLRKYLLETKEQADFRLVYLALHHIMKYRGNFLYEGQALSAEGNLEEEVREATNAYFRFMMPNDDRDCTEETVKAIKIAVADMSLGRMDTRTVIRDTLVAQGCERISAAEFGKALAGSKFDATKLFSFEGVEKTELALSSEDLESDIAQVSDEDAQVVLELMGRAYSASVLDEILGGCEGISSAMVKRYDEHAKQLRDFNDLVRDFIPDSYNEMFRKEGGNLKNYPNSIIGENSTRKDSERKGYACKREDFIKAAKSLLEGMPEEAHANTKHEKLLAAIESDTFLVKLRTRKNGAIPYQLHSQEMDTIIENQSVYYPALKAGYVDGEHRHRLVQILEFRIPYFVGPLSYNPDALESDRFDWLTRRVQGEKITPWNFNEVIDREQTAEDFITRMTGTCTYLLGEDVLPKHSILYQDFELLNELNKVSIDGKPISVDVKKQAFNELFTSRKKVTHKAFADWLINENHHPRDTSIKITGTQKETEFASSRSVLIDMQKIFDGKAEENIGRCEDIILWATLFNEKDMLKAKVERGYPEITKPQLKAIQKLRYKGWGRLSKKLLSGLRVQNRFGEKVSIIKIMCDTRMNFMEIINAKEYGFAELIEQTNEENIGINPTLSPKLLDDLVASPAVKRGIWQALLIVKELVQVMGAPPENIFIEMARGEQEKKRTVSRYNRLEELLKAVRSDSDYQDIIAEFDARKGNQKAFDDRALYLYFTQLGKCLYCGKDIHIDRLNRYQVDHIIPQSLTKDDSLENLALVHSECNQVKGDSLTINDDVRHSMGWFWRTLQGKKLIGSKKYNNL